MEYMIAERLEDTVTIFVTQMLDNFRQHGRMDPSRLLHFPDPVGRRSAMSVVRITYLASITLACILENRVITKRDVYYMCRSLFCNTQTVDRALETLSLCTGVPRNDLNVVAAPKGIVFGEVRFVDELGFDINVGMFGLEGCLIPSRPERMSHIKVGAHSVLM